MPRQIIQETVRSLAAAHSPGSEQVRQIEYHSSRTGGIPLERQFLFLYGRSMRLLNFVGIALNAVGSAILIFSSFGSPYGVAPKHAHPRQWQIGWVLLFLGFVVQAIAAYPR